MCFRERARLPPCCDAGERRVESRSELRDTVRQRITEILIFPAPETMTSHDDAAAEESIVLIPGFDFMALLRIQNPMQESAPEGIQVLLDDTPIDQHALHVTGLRPRRAIRFLRV